MRPRFVGGAVLDFGSLPEMNEGFALGGGLCLVAVCFELSATYLRAGRIPTGQPGANVEAWLAYATGRALFDIAHWAPFTVAAGLDLDAGVAVGTATGVRVRDAQSAALLWISVRGLLLAQVQVLPVWAIRLTGSLGTPCLIPSFSIGGIGPAYQPSTWLGQIALSLVFLTS